MVIVRLVLLVCALLLYTTSLASAQVLACTCQQTVECGADECYADESNICSSTEISLSIADPAIKLCAFSGCFEGPARRTQISDHIVVLDGAYTFSATPDVNAAQLAVMLDPSTGIGMIQSTSEEGITQYGVICEMPGRAPVG